MSLTINSVSGSAPYTSTMGNYIKSSQGDANAPQPATQKKDSAIISEKARELAATLTGNNASEEVKESSSTELNEQMNGLK